MFYSCRAKSRQTSQSFEDKKLQQVEIARFKRENTRLEDEASFLKKAAAHFAKLPKWSAMIKINEGNFSANLMCRIPKILRSGSTLGNSNIHLPNEAKPLTRYQQATNRVSKIIKDNGLVSESFQEIQGDD